MATFISAPPPIEKRHLNMTTTSKRVLRTKRTPLNKRKRTVGSSRYNPSEGSDRGGTKKPLTVAQIELFDKFIMPEGKPLTKRDKEISAMNDRALKAFQEEDQELFVKIISKAKSLYVRDDAVRLAAEVGWMEVAERLLVRKTSEVYEYPEGTASLSQAFAQRSDDCTVKDLEGRWLLKTAVLSAVRNNREAVFNLLVPIVGVDFTDLCSGDLVENVASSSMNMDTKKKWMRLITRYIDEKTSRLRLERAIYRCAEYQLIESIPYLLNCLFSTNKAPSQSVIAALCMAIGKHHQQVARCIIDGLGKASIPIARSPMYAAERVEDIEMIEYLYQNGCNSFPLPLYGENPALRLRQFLLKNNRNGLYHLIISE